MKNRGAAVALTMEQWDQVCESLDRQYLNVGWNLSKSECFDRNMHPRAVFENASARMDLKKQLGEESFTGQIDRVAPAMLIPQVVSHYKEHLGYCPTAILLGLAGGRAFYANIKCNPSKSAELDELLEATFALIDDERLMAKENLRKSLLRNRPIGTDSLIDQIKQHWSTLIDVV